MSKRAKQGKLDPRFYGPPLLGETYQSDKIVVLPYRPPVGNSPRWLWNENKEHIIHAHCKVEPNQEYEICYYPGKQGVIVLGPFDQAAEQRVLKRQHEPYLPFELPAPSNGNHHAA